MVADNCRRILMMAGLRRRDRRADCRGGLHPIRDFGGGGSLPKCHAAGTSHHRSFCQNGGGTPVPIEAAGMVSRRLHNASKNSGDLRVFPRTWVESTSSGKCRCINALASEVARHQQVTKTADIRFNSRRLHQPSRSIRRRLPRRSFSEGGLAQSVTHFGSASHFRAG